MSWQEDLAPDEVPPPWMWPHSEELNMWFDRVKADREAKTPGKDTPAPGGYMDNDLAKHWKQ